MNLFNLDYPPKKKEVKRRLYEMSEQGLFFRRRSYGWHMDGDAGVMPTCGKWIVVGFDYLWFLEFVFGIVTLEVDGGLSVY